MDLGYISSNRSRRVEVVWRNTSSMSVTVIDWKTWIICPVIGYFSIYNKKIISYNEGRVDTMTGMILIFMIRTSSMSQCHILGLSSQLFIGQYLIRYDILTWFSMISVFVLLNWRELKSVENSLCLTVSSTQWSVKRLPWSILEILHNSHVSRTEKWNNFYLVFSVCFWFPRSFHFYFWESEDPTCLNFTESFYGDINHQNIRSFLSLQIRKVLLQYKRVENITVDIVRVRSVFMGELTVNGWIGLKYCKIF